MCIFFNFIEKLWFITSWIDETMKYLLLKSKLSTILCWFVGKVMQQGNSAKSEMKVILCSYPDTRYYAQAIRWNVAKGIKSRIVFLIFIFLGQGAESYRP